MMYYVLATRCIPYYELEYCLVLFGLSDEWDSVKIFSNAPNLVQRAFAL